MDISSLQWLVGDKIESGKYDLNSHSWIIKFESGAALNIECMWRILKGDVISSTSEDHGHEFGLSQSFNGESALNEMRQIIIKSVSLIENIGDITIALGNLYILQIIISSSGYEAWQATHLNGQSVVASGGQLHVF